MYLNLNYKYPIPPLDAPLMYPRLHIYLLCPLGVNCILQIK